MTDKRKPGPKPGAAKTHAGASGTSAQTANFPPVPTAATPPDSVVRPDAVHDGTSGVQAYSLMPKSHEAQRVLEQRAKVLAQRTEHTHEKKREQFVCVRLGPSELYGIAYAHLEHTTHVANITRIPCTPPVIAGIANYRGELLTLLDLKQLFRTEASEQRAETTVVVVRTGKLRVGLIVDEIEGNDEFVAADLAPPMRAGGVSNLDYVQGIHQGRVTIMNINALLADPSLRVDESVK